MAASEPPSAGLIAPTGAPRADSGEGGKPTGASCAQLVQSERYRTSFAAGVGPDGASSTLIGANSVDGNPLESLVSLETIAGVIDNAEVMARSRIIPLPVASPIVDDPSTEDESDVSKAVTKTYQQAVVTGTDWTTETILSQLRRGNIDLNPRFQRRDAWTAGRKSRFVESLFIGLPVPQLVLAERPDRLGTFLVLDGKQRLLTLLQFAGISKAPDGSLQPPLELTSLEVRSDLNGLTMQQVDQSPRFSGDLNAFLNRTIRTAVVRNWPNDDLLYLVFLRLNTETVPLSPQELRQALHPGPFVDFLDDFSATCRPLQTHYG